MISARRAFAIAIIAALCFSAPQTFAQNAPPAIADKPFAEHRLILQLSDREPAKEALVLSVAYNLIKYYGPDKIAIEVVAFGPGVDLLLAKSANREKVDSLITQGVAFDICMNTVGTIERETGKKLELNPKAVRVEAGVGQILELTEKGYTLVRP